MIELPRSEARRLRDVFRRCAPRGPALWLAAGPTGLTARFDTPEVVAEYRRAGPLPVERLALPLRALADFEGGTDDPVTLTPLADRVAAAWSDRSVPRAAEYPAPAAGEPNPLPELGRFEANPPELRESLAEASRTAPKEAPGRYALHRVQLRGGRGEVVATDGKHLLIHGGFRFPWPGDLLVPRLPALAAKEWVGEPVAIGEAGGFVTVRVGAWSFGLCVDVTGKFPDAEWTVPRPEEVATRWRVAPEDADYLTGALGRLRGADDEHAPVTLDLADGTACVRARSGELPPTELALVRSAVEGPPVRLASDRRLLARALGLGFREFGIAGPGRPVVCREGPRLVVWVPLDPADVVPPSADARRVRADQLAPSKPRRSGTGGSRPSANGTVTAPRTSRVAGVAAARPPAIGDLDGLAAEAAELRSALREAHARAGRLVAAATRQRRQARLVESTLSSLRHLQRVGG